MYKLLFIFNVSKRFNTDYFDTFHFDVNTSLSSVPDTLHVQKLERHEIGTNLFRKNFHDVII
jgi:hypothetical protein